MKYIKIHWEKFNKEEMKGEWDGGSEMAWCVVEMKSGPLGGSTPIAGLRDLGQ